MRCWKQGRDAAEFHEVGNHPGQRQGGNFSLPGQVNRPDKWRLVFKNCRNLPQEIVTAAA